LSRAGFGCAYVVCFLFAGFRVVLLFIVGFAGSFGIFLQAR